LQSTLTRVWAEKGKPVEVPVKQAHKNFYIFSSVSPVTGDDFTLFLPEVNTDMMNIYLNELVQTYPEKRLLIFMDQAAWHKSKSLKKLDNVNIEYLPPYSPELNPVEKLWWWLRKEVTHNRTFETIDQMMDALQDKYQQLSPVKLKTLCNCSYL